MLTDYHLHTTFSMDATQTPDELCKQALSLGITHLAITDHVDIGPSSTGVVFDIADPKEYVRVIDDLRKRYPHLSIQRGMELGYVPEYWEEAHRRYRQIQPDFVLGSLHFVNRVDPYEQQYCQERTRQEAYSLYLETLLTAIPKLSQLAHVLAHLDYVSKFAPYPDPELRYEEFPELIDAVLQAVIDSGMALEINTSGYRTRPAPLPGPSVLRRYYMLGGRRITFGSDGHHTQYVGYALERAQKMAREIGFTRHSLWIQGKERQFHL